MVLGTVCVYALLVLIFTAVSIPLGSQEANVGGVRTLDTIPTHLVELASFGIVLGLGTLAVYGRRASWLVILPPFLVVLLDLDHLPIYIGIPQPIRPAHSLVFLATALLATGVLFRRMEIELILVSSFMGHMGVDTGLFPPFSPLTFDYVQLDQFRIPLLASSILLSLSAGFFIRRKVHRGTPE